jgi:hypothetical protein
LTALIVTGVAQAALINRGGGMIYDTTRNITWLSDMNYAATSGYAAANAGGTGSNLTVSFGIMGWDAAHSWATNLVYGGYSDWRLPTLNPSDTTCSDHFIPNGGGFPPQYHGYNCSSGELSGLFVTDLGNKENRSVLDPTGDTAEQVANLALFSNVQSYFYWSGTAYAPLSSNWWYFATVVGVQSIGSQGTAAYAVAVRDGDVSEVPESGTLALVALGLTGIGLVGRKRRRNK